VKYGLPDTAIQKIHAVLSRYPQVEKAVLYGSRAKGNYRNGSDIDLTLLGDQLNFSILTKIINNLDDVLFSYTIDLSLYSDIRDLDVIEHIRRVGIIFYSKETEESNPPLKSK
jgi:uncharacterized protein